MTLSVITINLNNREGLILTIESILSQTFKDFEFIIVDGGSVDGSVDIIKKYAGNRTIEWVSEPDNGIFHAMNKGINKASGNYLLFLNSGDSLCNSEVLNEVYYYLSQNSFDYIFGNFNIIQNNQVLYENVTLPFNEPTLFDLLSDSLPHQASFIKKSLFIKYGFYNENLKLKGDWEFCIRTIIVNNCSILHIPITTSNYDIQGISSMNPDINKKEKDTILNEHFPYRVISDFERFLVFKKELERIDWFTNHPHFYSLYKILFRLGKKICKK